MPYNPNNPFRRVFNPFGGEAQTYQRRILNLFAGNIVGYWPLQETAGATAYDVGPNGYHGSISSVTVGQPGAPGHGLSYYGDGVNDQVTLPAASMGNIPAAGTLMMWGKPNTAWTSTGTNYTIFGLNSVSDQVRFITSSGATNRIACYTRFNATQVTIYVDQTTEWAHLAFTYSMGGNITAYLNGVQVGAPVSGVGSVTAAISAAYIFFYTSQKACWVSHAVFLNRVATAAEIAQAAR